MFLLLKDLQAALVDVFATTVFRAPQTKAGQPEAYRPVQVCIASLPPKRKDAEQGEDFPYVVIRATRGTLAEKSGAREENVTVRFLVGVYTGGTEADGAQDLDVMTQRIKHMLATRRLWDGGRWERELPISWEAGLRDENNAQPHPYYGGYIEATFSAPGAVEVLNFDGLG